MVIKIKESKIGLVLSAVFVGMVAFVVAVVYFSFASEQNAWQTFVTLCNGIAANCQEILYGSVQNLVLQKNLVIGTMALLSLVFTSFIFIDLYRTRKFVSKFDVIKTIGNFVIVRSKDLVAFTAGYLSPKIYLSEKLFEKLNEHELNAVLLHEKSHAKTLDNLRNLVLRSLSKTFFFFPILKDVEKIVSERHENSADNSVIHQMINGRKYLLSSMLKFDNKLKLNASLSYFSARSERLISFVEPIYKISIIRLLVSIMVIVIIALGLFSQNSYAKNLVVSQCTESSVKETEPNMTLISEGASKLNSCNSQ